MQTAIKAALLKALQGKPVSSITAKPKAKPALNTVLNPAEADARHARFMKDFHGLPGFKHKAQTETIRDKAYPYLVAGIHAKRGLPEW